MLENTYAVIYGVGEGPRERRPQMVDMLNMIGAAQWLRYVTGALGLALRLKTP